METIKSNDNNCFILPLRFIPFDIGSNLSNEKIKLISERFDTNYKRLPASDYFQSIGSDLVLIYQLDEKKNIKAFIFSYGTGVISYADRPYQIENLNGPFSFEYCQQRKQAHRNILFSATENSELIQNFIEEIRVTIRESDPHVRQSSHETWESGGLSYVMTVSMIQTGRPGTKWQDLSDAVKRNLLVLLKPSIVNMEDSLYAGKHTNVERDIASIPLTREEEPENFSYSAHYGLYISWASVVTVQETIQLDLIEMLEAMEADLQAMWMYLYCERNELKVPKKKKRLILENNLYSIQRKYVRFTAVEDSSAPEYITRIRSALIRTSGLKELFTNYIEEIRFSIQQLKIQDDAHDRKISYYRTILLTITTGIQIITFCHRLLKRGDKKKN